MLKGFLFILGAFLACFSIGLFLFLGLLAIRFYTDWCYKKEKNNE